MDADDETEAVEQRHGGEHAVAGAEHRVRRDDLGGEGVEVAVREHDALRGAGRAAGIEDDGGVAAVALDLVIPRAGMSEADELLPADDRRVLRNLADLAPLGQHIARLDRRGERVLDARDDDVHDLGVLADALKLVVKLVERDRRHGVGGV